MDTNTVITNWKKGTTEFECINPNGVSTILGTSKDGEAVSYTHLRAHETG